MSPQTQKPDEVLVEYYLARFPIIHRALNEKGIVITNQFLKDMPVKSEWFFPGGKKPENFPARYSEVEHNAAIKEAALFYFTAVDAPIALAKIIPQDNPYISANSILDLARHVSVIRPGSKGFVAASARASLQKSMQDWDNFGATKQKEIVDFLVEERLRISESVLRFISAKYRKGDKVFADSVSNTQQIIHDIDTNLLSGKAFRVDLQLDSSNNPTRLQCDYVTTQGDWRRMEYTFEKGKTDDEAYYTRTEYALSGRSDSKPRRIDAQERKALNQEEVNKIKATAPGLDAEQPTLDRGAEIWVNGALQSPTGNIIPIAIIHGLIDQLVPVKIKEMKKDGSILNPQLLKEAVASIAIPDHHMTQIPLKDMDISGRDGRSA